MSELSKAIWITGTSSGIGRALAIEFAKNGETVIATSRRKDLIQNFKKELGLKSKNIIHHQLDISSPDAVISFYSQLSENYFINGLINNAGLTSFKSASEDSIEEIEKIINVNLLGSIYSIKTVLPSMIANNNGTIINILSVVTQKTFTNSSVYSASKQGLLAYSKVLREELRNYNIRVMNVSPGATKTSIWPNNVLEEHSHRMMVPEEIAKLIYQIYSLKSNIVAEEIVLRPIQGDL
ncbi:MAG: SDR family oxidoreductase [Melioribacteraceae bacterium]|jgi:short-subunit dehydrogenase|nr:SDR family oxidoreductase [Melioribacteraceae bacterium]